MIFIKLGTMMVYWPGFNQTEKNGVRWKKSW